MRAFSWRCQSCQMGSKMQRTRRLCQMSWDPRNKCPIRQKSLEESPLSPRHRLKSLLCTTLKMLSDKDCDWCIMCFMVFFLVVPFVSDISGVLPIEAWRWWRCRQSRAWGYASFPQPAAILPVQTGPGAHRHQVRLLRQAGSCGECWEGRILSQCKEFHQPNRW